jgi:hypothetical protein
LKLLSLLFLLVLLLGCGRKPAPPVEAFNLHPWGSLDLNISSNAEPFSIKASLGSALLKKYKTRNAEDKPEFNILAISGGGSHGAYGIGLINGWKHKGDIPKFDVVTGISTGSIISSFIFLGGEYTQHISELYTSINTEDIYHYNFFKIFGGSSVTSTAPFKDMLQKEISEELLQKVALEYAKGRRLYIGTTNIDAGRFTVWDMGAIAASNNPRKLQLYRDIIYASSSMPGIFDPQYFEIKYKNSTYYQVHVDGSMYAHVFMIGLLENWRDILHIDSQQENIFNVNLYVVGNRKYRFKNTKKPLSNDYSATILVQVATHAVDMLFDRSLYRLYKACEDKNFNFYYKGIDDTVRLDTYSHQFIPEDMNHLYAIGYEEAIKGIPWKREILEDELLLH